MTNRVEEIDRAEGRSATNGEHMNLQTARVEVFFCNSSVQRDLLQDDWLRQNAGRSWTLPAS